MVNPIWHGQIKGWNKSKKSLEAFRAAGTNYFSKRVYPSTLARKVSRMINPIYYATGTTNSTGSVWFNVPTSTTGTTPYYDSNSSIVPVPYVPDTIDLADGKARTLHMKDGTVINVKADGTFIIDDANAKTVYRGCPTRDFNSFLNASDKIEEFIKFCGEVGVRQGDMLGIPLKHFIAWLIVESAKADGEDPPALPDFSRPRCPSCGRFMSSRMKAARIDYCRTTCFDKRLLAFKGESDEVEEIHVNDHDDERHE